MIRVFFLSFFLIISFSTKASEVKIADRSNAKKSILGKLKGEDFGHAGDIEALKFAIDKIGKINKYTNNNALDLASGYGATANFLSQMGFKKIWGVDQDKNAITYSSLKYPNTKFFNLDYDNLTLKFRKNFFSFIYMYNVTYPFENKENLLEQVTKISKKGAILIIFDYLKEQDNINLTGSKIKPIRDFYGNIIQPMNIEKMNNILTKKGWKIKENLDMTEKYILWYQEFIKNVSLKRKDLNSLYSEKDIEEVENLFNKILFNLLDRKLGGYMIIAEKI